MASNSGYTELTDRPLFGETRHLDRILFIIITAITTVFVLATFIGMFIFHHFNGFNLFLNLCLLLLLVSHLCLAFWYRTGDLEPRFRHLLIYNTTVIVLFCISINLIIREKS